MFRAPKQVIKSEERKKEEKRWDSVDSLILWFEGGGQWKTRNGQDEMEKRYQIVTYALGEDVLDSEGCGGYEWKEMSLRDSEL